MPQPLALDALFTAIDRKDLGTYLGFLTPDCRLRFGNRPVGEGHDEITKVVGNFFSQVVELRHTLAERWDLEDVTICRGEVTYQRTDGSELTVPVAHIFKTKEGLVSEYNVYIDVSGLAVTE